MTSQKEKQEDTRPSQASLNALGALILGGYLSPEEVQELTKPSGSNEELMPIEQVKTELERYFHCVKESFNVHDAPFSEYIEILNQLYTDFKKNHPKEGLVVPSLMPQTLRKQLGLRRTLVNAVYIKPGSLIYYIDAVSEGFILCFEYESLKAQGNEIGAKNLLMCANVACKECANHLAENYRKENRTKKAKKGAEAKFKKQYGDAISLCLELLKNKKPTDGWPSAAQAAKAVTPELQAFLAANGLATSEADFEETVKGWILKDERMRSLIPRLSK